MHLCISHFVYLFLSISVNRLKAAGSDEIECDMIPIYQHLALDVLNLSAFGLDTNSQRYNAGYMHRRQIFVQTADICTLVQTADICTDSRYMYRRQ